MMRLPVVAMFCLLPATANADAMPIQFTAVDLGATTDPTGLWTPQEITDGGSVVQPSVWHSTFPVDGGEVTISVLLDHWCSMAECPYRVRLSAPAAGLDLRGEGMACQARDTFTYDPLALTISACGQIIDLKKLVR